MVGAAQGIRCATCERMKRPGTRRPARVVRPLDFNQEICIDILNLYDTKNNKVETMSILDLATGYHVVKRISGKKSTDYMKDFNDFWMGWAGPPDQVTVDQERVSQGVRRRIGEGWSHSKVHGWSSSLATRSSRETGRVVSFNMGQNRGTHGTNAQGVGLCAGDGLCCKEQLEEEAWLLTRSVALRKGAEGGRWGH